MIWFAKRATYVGWELHLDWEPVFIHVVK